MHYPIPLVLSTKKGLKVESDLMQKEIRSDLMQKEKDMEQATRELMQKEQVTRELNSRMAKLLKENTRLREEMKENNRVSRDFSKLKRQVDSEIRLLERNVLVKLKK